MVHVSKKPDPELRRLAKGARVAVIPVGALEQHGAHLPVSADSDIVTAIAERISEKRGWLLLPTIQYGVSFEHAPLFNVSLRRGTLRGVISDICASLYELGIRDIFVLNGHHGNLDALKGLGERIQEGHGGRLGVFILSYWHYMGRDFDHAGFVETSLMLAVSNKVRMGHAKKGLVTAGMPKAKVRELGRLASKSFPSVAKGGVWGDPTGATKAKGRAILAKILKNMEKECQTCLGGGRP